MIMEDVTITPTDREKEEALALLPQIEVISKRSAKLKGSITIAAGDVKVVVPRGAVQLLTGAIKAIAEGKTIQLTEIDNEVSTQEAAAILNVSRPYVVKLFDSGEIKGRMVGNQRRMLRADVEAYHQKTRAARRDAKVEMTRLTQEIENFIEEKKRPEKR